MFRFPLLNIFIDSFSGKSLEMKHLHKAQKAQGDNRGEIAMGVYLIATLKIPASDKIR